MEKDFVRSNLEKNAIKYAFKKLKSRINNELLKIKRLSRKDSGFLLVLGYKDFNVFIYAVERGLLSDSDYVEAHILEENGKLKFWNLPVYIDRTEEYMVKIVTSGIEDLDGIAEYFSNPLAGGSLSPSIDELISELPKGVELKKVNFDS